jgi:CubicO group peptidase (beta-lactamase class C family)
MTARDMGRFGLLILADGEWNGQQIMKDKSYFHAMIDTSQELNPSYGYLWWLNGKASKVSVGRQSSVKNGPLIPTAPLDLICANGKGSQHIYIVPSQNLVVVRLGDAPETAKQGVQAESAGGSSASFNTQLWEKLMLAVQPQRAIQP